jgi:anti-sigma factor RsiW
MDMEASMIACAEQLISEYVDGDLPATVADELEQHLVVCAECRAMLLDYYLLVAATQSLAVARHLGQGRRQGGNSDTRRRDILGQVRPSDLPA